MQVPFLDLRVQNNSIMPELKAALSPVIENAQFILGPAVEAFEKDFAAYIGTRECVGLNNGTSALHMALLALGIKPGDEIITTPHTWISTSWAISYVGAKPVYVDIDSQTYNLDPARVKSAITSKTKAILPVHLYGQAADVVQLRRFADEHGLALLEDAAQAHGAKQAGRRIGSIGHVGSFSFYPGKNLGAFGEGGAIVTDDPQIAAHVRRLRDHAQDGRHNHVEIGFNTRMEGMQGAVLKAKLPHLDGWNARRREHAAQYGELLANTPGIILPACPAAEGHVWHLYVVQIEAMDREVFRAKLAEQGIATGVHYPTTVPLQPAYQYLGHRPGDFPIAEQVMARCVSLPMFAELSSEQVAYTAATIREVLATGE
jgi:dTDP-4-amino-4,6-dideoxygalactose transaminase